MSKKKQKPILSDKIAELMAPRRLLDPEIDSEDETAAKVFDYDLEDEIDGRESTSKLSDIRKKNVKLLHDVDAKYRGKVSSRKDLEMDSEQSEEIEDEEESNDIESDSDEDADMKSFAEKLKNSSKKRVQNDEPNSDLEVYSDDESLENGDNDFEDQEAEEEQEDEELEDEDEELDGEQSDSESFGDEEEKLGEEDADEEFNSDDEESDFDGGDIIAQTTEKPEKPDVSKILPKKHSDDQIQKGACVQNQLQIWEKLLEVRIHSQKVLIKANSLPFEEKFQQLADNDEKFTELAAETEQNVFKLISQMNELQSILLRQYPETKDIARKRKPLVNDNNEDTESATKRNRISDRLGEDYANFREYQYGVISKWHDRTKMLTPGSVKTQKQQGTVDVLRKIESVLANKDDLVRKSQLLKGGCKLFDESCATFEPKANRMLDEHAKSTEDENKEDMDVYCTEVYDDSDFYHTQLRELIEYKTSTSSNANEMAKQFNELQKLRKKMKKSVDTRASKGRKIRYVVHNKLVSFMAPNDPAKWNDDQKNELFKSLFGAQT